MAFISTQVKSAAGASHYEESHYSPTFESQALVSPDLVTLWLHPDNLTAGAAGQLDRPGTCVEGDRQPLDRHTVHNGRAGLENSKLKTPRLDLRIYRTCE